MRLIFCKLYICLSGAAKQIIFINVRSYIPLYKIPYFITYIIP